MAKKEKIPKVKYTESKSLNKKINKAIQSKSLSGLSLSEMNQVLSALQGNPSYDQLYKSLNPEQKQYVDLNIGNPEGREAGLFRSKKAHYEKISQLTPEQSRAAYAFLENTIPEAFLPENATKEQIAAAKQQGLSGTLSALEKPYESPLNTQLNSMFGHMANPVLQNFLNPQQGNQPQVLFPSQLPQHYAQQNQQSIGGMQDLLGQLGGQAGQYALQNLPEGLNYAGNLAGQGLQYGQQGLQNAYQSVAPYAQDLYGGASAFANKFARVAPRVPGRMYKDISSLLSALGSYIPGRQKQG